MEQVLTYTNKQKKQLFARINTLSKTEHEEIYKILTEHNDGDGISFSKNKNGVFFNLSDVSDELYNKIDSFVQYCINNNKSLDDYDKKINECKINNNYANIIHINFDTMPLEEQDDSKNVTEDWNNVIVDAKSIQRVAAYVERMMADRDKLGKKKVNAKFNNARKKYAKRQVNEKKIDSELQFELSVDPYLITI